MLANTARCLHCELIQFVTERNQCRRCHKGLVPEEERERAQASPLALVPAPASDLSHIGATIRTLRLQRNLSQNDLAFRMCIARPYISKVESGKNMPTLPSLYRFAKALRVDVAAILSEPWKSDPFIAEIAPYVSQLDSGTREYILDRVRELATAK